MKKTKAAQETFDVMVDLFISAFANGQGELEMEHIRCALENVKKVDASLCTPERLLKNPAVKAELMGMIANMLSGLDYIEATDEEENE
jgi:hypothetical protein